MKPLRLGEYIIQQEHGDNTTRTTKTTEPRRVRLLWGSGKC